MPAPLPPPPPDPAPETAAALQRDQRRDQNFFQHTAGPIDCFPGPLASRSPANVSPSPGSYCDRTREILCHASYIGAPSRHGRLAAAAVAAAGHPSLAALPLPLLPGCRGMALEGRVAVVTGATGIVGEGIARAFLEAGATVVAPIRSAGLLKRVSCLLVGHGCCWRALEPAQNNAFAFVLAQCAIDVRISTRHDRSLRQAAHMTHLTLQLDAGKEAGLRAALGSPPADRLITPVEDYSHIEGVAGLVLLFCSLYPQ